MTYPVWRNVRSSPEFDARLDHYFGSDPAASAFVAALLDHEIIRYVFQAFREDWDNLKPVTPGEPDGRERYYAYTSELAEADLIIYGRLDAVTLFENYSEQDITIYYLIVHHYEQPLEDPTNPIPDR